MSNYDVTEDKDPAKIGFGLRDLLVVLFRHKRMTRLCFLGLLAGTMLAAMFVPLYYESKIDFLVERQRADPAVSPQNNPQVTMQQSLAVTDEEINSEVALLQDEDVLRQVVVSSGLDKRKTMLGTLLELVFGPADSEKRIQREAKKLGSDLKIEPIKKSTTIEVTYKSKNAQLSAQVLRSLGDAYLRKHMDVFTPPGQVQFFDQEVERYEKELNDAEAQLKQFSQQENAVAPQVDRDITLQKLGEFRLSLYQAQSDLAAAEQRIRTLEKQAGATPERLTTSLRNSDDAPVLQGLKNTLMTLELKRTELLTKYQPTYPLVQEVDKQIAETRASIATEESKPIKEETTDRNPTYAWLDEELAKAKAEYRGLQARVAAQQAIVANYQAKVHDLEQKDLIHQGLLRSQKANEENYLSSLQKREQARMTDALDNTRIANVAVAEPPMVSVIPWNPRWLMALIGVFLTTVLSAGAIYIQERRDPSFRTPAEVTAALEIPLLAAVPQRFNAFHTNGNGNGSRNGGRTTAHSSSETSAKSILS